MRGQSFSARLLDDVEALFTTSEGSWDGAGTWSNWYLCSGLRRDWPGYIEWTERQRCRLRTHGYWREHPQYTIPDPLAGRVSAALRTLNDCGTIARVVDRLAAPGGHTTSGIIYRLVDDEDGLLR